MLDNIFHLVLDIMETPKALFQSAEKEQIKNLYKLSFHINFFRKHTELIDQIIKDSLVLVLF